MEEAASAPTLENTGGAGRACAKEWKPERAGRVGTSQGLWLCRCEVPGTIPGVALHITAIADWSLFRPLSGCWQYSALRKTYFCLIGTKLFL